MMQRQISTVLMLLLFVGGVAAGDPRRSMATASRDCAVRSCGGGVAYAIRISKRLAAPRPVRLDRVGRTFAVASGSQSPVQSRRLPPARAPTTAAKLV